MRIIRKINKQAKANGGVGHKVWVVTFSPKELLKISQLKGNTKGLVYAKNTEFIIETDLFFTKGFIATSYDNPNFNTRIDFTVKVDSSSELYHKISIETIDEKGKVIDTFNMIYNKGIRSFKTSALYQYFNHIVIDTYTLASISSEYSLNEYENNLRTLIKKRDEQKAEQVLCKKQKRSPILKRLNKKVDKCI